MNCTNPFTSKLHYNLVKSKKLNYVSLGDFLQWSRWNLINRYSRHGTSIQLPWGLSQKAEGISRQQWSRYKTRLVLINTGNYLYFRPLFSLEIKMRHSVILFILPLQVWAPNLGKTCPRDPWPILLTYKWDIFFSVACLHSNLLYFFNAWYGMNEHFY